MISTEKQILRARMQETLRAMSAADRAKRSARIAAHLSRLPGLVLGFAPLQREPAWWDPAASLDVAVPRIEGNRLIFHRVTELTALERGAFGAREPRVDERTCVVPESAAWILVPGLAFDRAGGRLGRGGGHYDRFLSKLDGGVKRIAIAFGCQDVDRVPLEAHDARVDAIVTEGGWLDARSSARDRD